MVDQGRFNSRALDRFWRFVHDRHRVWTKRVICGSSPPWSDDPILRRYRFTNVYRVLDPGTQYAIQQIVDRDERDRDKLFNLLVYRLIGRQETHRELGFLRLDSFDPDRFEATLKTRRDEAENAVFTGAYLVSGYAGMGSSDKIENVTAIFKRIVASETDTLTDVLTADSMAEAYCGIRSLPGFGRFLAYQVLVDLLYPVGSNDDRSVLPFSQNEWVIPGPGAQKGLAVLAGGTPNDPPAVIKWLQTHQAEAFEQRGLAFPYLLNRNGRTIGLSLADIQNCLCEYYKYHKVATATGRTRRRFRHREARSTRELRALYRQAPGPITLQTKKTED